MKALIVDDSEVMRWNIKSLLQGNGYDNIIEARNGKEAIRVYRTEVPEIVTMDINMPYMDGISAVKNIITEFPLANIIMISAVSDKKAIFESMKNGAKYYLIKPVDSKNFNEAIKKVKEDNNSTIVRNPYLDDPFTVEKVGIGNFLIKISNSIDMSTFAKLKSTVISYMFIKPLILTFDFGIAIGINKEVLKYIDDLINVMKSTGAIVVVKCRSENQEISEYFKLY